MHFESSFCFSATGVFPLASRRLILTVLCVKCVLSRLPDHLVACSLCIARKRTTIPGGRAELARRINSGHHSDANLLNSPVMVFAGLKCQICRPTN